MTKYVENHLGRDETVIKKAEISWIVIVPDVVLMLLLIGFITIWKPLIAKLTTELAVTNKKVVGKVGLIRTKALDAPLNKINNVSVSSGLIGKIFGYGTVRINTSSGEYLFPYIKGAESFKTLILNRIDIFDEERITKQAQMMASAIKND